MIYFQNSYSSPYKQNFKIPSECIGKCACATVISGHGLLFGLRKKAYRNVLKK